MDYKLSLLTDLGIDLSELSIALNLDKKRLKDQNLNIPELSRFLDLQKVITLLNEVFLEDKEKMKAWLWKKNNGLHHLRPLDLIYMDKLSDLNYLIVLQNDSNNEIFRG